MSWRASAACSGMGEVFFPEGGMSPAEVEVARDVCLGCGVRAECREYALGLDEDPIGVWGGLSRNQRAKARRERQATCQDCGVEVERRSNRAPKWCEDCAAERHLAQKYAHDRRRPLDVGGPSCGVCGIADAAPGSETCQAWACQRIHRRRALDSELVA